MPSTVSSRLKLAVFGLGLAVWSFYLFSANPAIAVEQDPEAATRNEQRFRERIWPVLEAKCLSCHGEAKISGFDLRTRNDLMKGGSRGPAVVPGNAEKSLLYDAILQRGQLSMPPSDKLAPEEIAAIKDWINEGAHWPKDLMTDRAPRSDWWSFKPIVQRPVPESASEWTADATSPRNTHILANSANPIDAFVLQKLKANGMKPAPPADRRTLLRRVYFDLTGLPPAPEEVKAFLDDDAPNAYEKVVDRLLGSQRYGEKWGSYWLDVVRYADTGGFETDMVYINAWRYRDYVIKSFNDDKPYDRFIKEQVAGDEIWPDQTEARIATGLYTIGPRLHESAMIPAKDRSEILTEWADTTAAAFLGLTMGCARCHDHKYDPISQKDYYALQAVFAGSEEQEMILTEPFAQNSYKAGLARYIYLEQTRAQLEQLTSQSRQRLIEKIKEKYRPEEVAAYNTPRRKRTPEQTQLSGKLEDEVGMISDEDMQEALSAEERKRYEQVKLQLADAYLRAPRPLARAAVLGPARTVQPVQVLNRGDYEQPKGEVAPNFPSVLRNGQKFQAQLTLAGLGRRKALAEWLTRPNHPLTARVIVNRIWQGHFGEGLVRTPNDFGKQGDQPTHPELLDWLAAEFVKEGWSFKKLHKLILMSNTYRMSSTYQPAFAEKDPDNRLLWRMSRRRLSGEELIDAMRSISGTLNLKMFGPPVVPPLNGDEMAGLFGNTKEKWPVTTDVTEHRRRSIYFYVKRSFRYPLFETFDMPDRTSSCGRRIPTTVAPQALTMINGPQPIELAASLADRLLKDAKPDRALADRVEAAYRLTLGRAPSKEEMEHSLKFLGSGDKQSLVEFCLGLFNTNEFAYVD